VEDLMAARNVLTRERLQRLQAGRTLFELAAASGFQRLTPEQERRRRAAIDRLNCADASTAAAS